MNESTILRVERSMPKFRSNSTIRHACPDINHSWMSKKQNCPKVEVITVPSLASVVLAVRVSGSRAKPRQEMPPLLDDLDLESLSCLFPWVFAVIFL